MVGLSGEGYVAWLDVRLRRVPPKAAPRKRRAPSDPQKKEAFSNLLPSVTLAKGGAVIRGNGQKFSVNAAIGTG